MTHYCLFRIAIIVLTGVGLGCKSSYLVNDFAEKTRDHKSIATLPVEMIFTGVMPEDWTERDIQDIEYAESQSFQISFYQELLRSTRSGRKSISMELQHYRKTWQLLETANIELHEIWALPSEEAAQLLGVDAVVRARITKTRFMSDLASYGIEVATRVVGLLTDYYLIPWIPHATRSKKIQAEYTLFEGEQGGTLWSISFEQDADWRRPANEIIDNISRRAARHFPYRN